MGKAIVPDDAAIDAAVARATAAGTYDQPVAENVRYIPGHDLYILGLTDGSRLVLQREKLQGLQSATKRQLANVSVEMLGTGLHWEDLDVDLYVPQLIRGVFGTRKWMSELGRAGGSVRSRTKAKTSRANGAKGGRPRKAS